MTWERFFRVTGFDHYIKNFAQVVLLLLLILFCGLQEDHILPKDIPNALELITEKIPEKPVIEEAEPVVEQVVEEKVVQEEQEEQEGQEEPKEEKPRHVKIKREQSVEQEVEEYLDTKQELEEINTDDGQEVNEAIEEIQEQFPDWYNVNDSIFNYYSPEDVQYLFRAVETEVHGGDFESKAHVASVIMNRIEAYDASTFKEIVTAPNQFVYGKTNVSEDTILACEYAFQVGDTTQGSLNFHSGTKTDTFSGRDYVFTDDVGHHFYN